MSLILVSDEIMVATETIRCEASADLIDLILNRNQDGSLRKYVPVAFKVRRCQILKGYKYKLYQFTDAEGEVMEMKCSMKIDDFMIRNKLYPPLVLDAIKNKQ